MRNPLSLIIAAFYLICMPNAAQAGDSKSAARIPGVLSAAKAGTVFRDCPDCPAMVVIPAGHFAMGSPGSEDSRSDDEGPVHRVKVAAFALGRTEITRGQFAVFARSSNYSVGDNCRTLEGGKFERRNGRTWRDLGFLQNDKHPVACISWDDAQAYAKWLSHRTGKRYRLPTEAEWEYAARGRSVTARYWGDNPDKACRYANVANKTAQAMVAGAMFWQLHGCTDGFDYTAPAGSFKANAFGLKDMLGNVWEWTEDSFHNSYEDAPTAGNEWAGDGKQRVIRGGSWNSDPGRVRAAKRGRDIPSNRFSNIGFRVARTLP